MKKDHFINLIIGIVSSVLATMYFFGSDYLFGRPLDSPQKSSLLLLLLIVGLSTVSILGYQLFRWAVRSVIRPSLTLEIRQELEQTLRAQIDEESTSNLELMTGIVRVFNKFPECENEILEQVQTSKSMRVFLQIGKIVLGGSTNFYDYIGKAASTDAQVKILYAGLDSPYLSERIAHERNSDYKEWKADLEHAFIKMANLMEKSRGAIRGRRHSEGFVWRLFIFDDVAYVQPYLQPRDNSNRAPVLKISRVKSSKDRAENESSLYSTFANYFDFKWDECRPTSTSLTRLIHTAETTSVAVAAKYNQFYVFAIPSRYMTVGSKEVPFHAIGGKRKPNEPWTETAKRETHEETGVNISLISSSQTHFHTTGAELESVNLDDTPRPYCVYKRTRDADPNFANPEVLWLVGYEGVLLIKNLDELKPRAEVGGLICMTGDLLRKTLQERVTYRDIDKAGDGSRVILGDNAPLDLDARAIPAGLAVLIAADQRPKHLRLL